MLQELLVNPAVQAAAAPFSVALVLALVLQRWFPWAVGVAVIAGFLVAVWLTTGLTFQPLTSTRKIILSSILLPFVLLLLESTPFTLRFRQLVQMLPAATIAAAALWVIWPVVQRQEIMAAWQMAVPVVLFVAVTVYATGLLARSQRDDAQGFSAQAANVLMLAMGSGAVSLIAASALYSQLAFAVSASAGATIVAILVTTKKSSAWLGKLAPYASVIPVALFTAAATVYAKLPVTVLLCLVLVPLFAWLPLPRPRQRWLQLVVSCLWAGLPVVPAVWLAWQSAGPVSF